MSIYYFLDFKVCYYAGVCEVLVVFMVPYIEILPPICWSRLWTISLRLMCFIECSLMVFRNMAIIDVTLDSDGSAISEVSNTIYLSVDIDTN